MNCEVFTIVVTYNGMEWVDKCIQSLLTSNLQTKIILVDNGSTDGTINHIQVHYPEIHLICSELNLGFGKANNIGISSAMSNGADYVFLLNQDAWIEKETISSLVRNMEQHDKLGILSPVHLNRSGTALDIYFRRYFLASDLKDFLDTIFTTNAYYNKLIKTSFVNAASWMISRQCIQKTGGFDPIFFHYGEDVNYAQRIAFAGFEMAIDTGSKIYHDREERILRQLGIYKFDRNKEWNHFLNEVCNPSEIHFKTLAIKRGLRYTFFGFYNLVIFNFKKGKDHFYIVKKILSSSSLVKKSRERSFRGDFIC